jgi:hypothetical protein
MLHPVRAPFPDAASEFGTASEGAFSKRKLENGFFSRGHPDKGKSLKPPSEGALSGSSYKSAIKTLAHKKPLVFYQGFSYKWNLDYSISQIEVSKAFLKS